MFWKPQIMQNDHSYRFTAIPKSCVGPIGHEFLMGGVAMASAIDALQSWADKPLLWATIQFLNPGSQGDEVDITLAKTGGGRRIIQAGATLKNDSTTLQTMVAALGARDSETDIQFVQSPDVKRPNECSIKTEESFNRSGDLMDQFERRTALEDEAAGLECMWIRPKFGTEVSAPLLALTSDFFLGAHKRCRGGTSLDNTIRICGLKSTGWILSVTQMKSIRNGIVQGSQHQFSEDGTLLSISSQTGLLPR